MTKFLSGEVSNPYKPLFSLGCVLGALGVSVWWFFDQGWIDFYPRQSHYQIMFFAFFWCFVSGFLMTAIPRMTGSHLAGRFEVAAALFLALSQALLNLTNQTNLAAYLYLLQLVFLLAFILRRFLIKRRVPFDGFIFMPAAFFMATLGIIFFKIFGDQKFLLIFSGEAFLLNLIIGLGSRLVPALSRLPNAFMHPGAEFKPNYLKAGLKMLSLNLSFVFEFMGLSALAFGLRFFVVLFIGIFDFGLFRRGTVFSMVALGLKAAVFMLLLGYSLKALNVSLIPSGHLVYIGGFSLLTLMVASRVTLAHSQTNLDYELKSLRLASVSGFFILATVLRWWSGYSLNGPLFWGSIVLFILALTVWLDKHLRLLTAHTIQKD